MFVWSHFGFTFIRISERRQSRRNCLRRPPKRNCASLVMSCRFKVVQLCSSFVQLCALFSGGETKGWKGCFLCFSFAAFVMLAAGHWPGRVPYPRLKRAALPCWPDLQFGCFNITRCTSMVCHLASRNNMKQVRLCQAGYPWLKRSFESFQRTS